MCLFLCLLQDLLFIFDFQQFYLLCLCVFLKIFIPFGICQASWICNIFHQFWEILPLFPQNIFFCSTLISSLSEVPITCMLDCLILSHRSSEFLFSFLQSFFCYFFILNTFSSSIFKFTDSLFLPSPISD